MGSCLQKQWVRSWADNKMDLMKHFAEINKQNLQLILDSGTEIRKQYSGDVKTGFDAPGDDDDAGQAQHHMKTGDEKNNEKEVRKMKDLLEELIETERNYVSDLEEVCVSYAPLHRTKSVPGEKARLATCGGRRPHSYPTVNQSYNQNTGEWAPDVDKKDMRDLLGNIEDIKDFHKKVIITKLEKAGTDSGLIRELFEVEEPKLTMKYGRYCINTSRRSHIMEQNKLFFTLYQANRGLSLRLDGHLIKPIQRITRYHLFLSSLSKTAQCLGDEVTARNYEAALDCVLAISSHTDTMTWVGGMDRSPINLSSQGQLLKHGQLLSKKINEKFINKSKCPCYLILFQQTAVLCKIKGSSEKNTYPELDYWKHLNLNHIKAVVKETPKTFVIKRITLKDEDLKEECEGMKLECKTNEEMEVWVDIVKNEIEKLQAIAFSLSYTLS